ncbi:Baculoviral IAP repeat-containing protein 6 [Dissostichus eleginoides]|uniref:Baculoviral IAP repeat-containing protein 6 n=1 Tax=Dissostichus eleginoides TaxID=100907 RepID=A0AAD9F0G8_DISEL|nr:Baculoviral IAP repeat-containing protein 6 [Dissostichus eleginoides]
MTRDQQASSTVLDVFPRFLDIPGLVDQDFTMMFGEEISGKMLARWPTFFKPRILADCKNLHSNVHVDDLLSAQQNSNESGWDSDLSSILLLVHLLPPTSKGHKKSAKISSYQAVSHVVRYLKIRAKHFPTVHCPGEEETCHCKKKGRMTFAKLGGREEMKG